MRKARTRAFLAATAALPLSRFFFPGTLIAVSSMSRCYEIKGNKYTRDGVVGAKVLELSALH